MAEIVPLQAGEKRLKSLDEFVEPPWVRRVGTAGNARRAIFWCLFFGAILVGTLFGLWLPL